MSEFGTNAKCGSVGFWAASGGRADIEILAIYRRRNLPPSSAAGYPFNDAIGIAQLFLTKVLRKEFLDTILAIPGTPTRNISQKKFGKKIAAINFGNNSAPRCRPTSMTEHDMDLIPSTALEWRRDGSGWRLYAGSRCMGRVVPDGRYPGMRAIRTPDRATLRPGQSVLGQKCRPRSCKARTRLRASCATPSKSPAKR